MARQSNEERSSTEAADTPQSKISARSRPSIKLKEQKKGFLGLGRYEIFT